MPSRYRMTMWGRREGRDAADAAIQEVEALLAQDALKGRIDNKRRQIKLFEDAIVEARKSRRSEGLKITLMILAVMVSGLAIASYFVEQSFP